MTTPNYTEEELRLLFKSVGKNVQVHRSAALFNTKKITLGSNVRIDCFSLLSAGNDEINIGDYVHIAAATHLFGSGGNISIENFSNISSRVSIFTMNDDYVEGTMTNPMIPEEFKQLTRGNVFISKHAIVGCGTIILPNVTIGLGGSIGALSLVNRSIEPFEVVAGIPIRKIRERKRTLLDLEKQFLTEVCHS